MLRSGTEARSMMDQRWLFTPKYVSGASVSVSRFSNVVLGSSLWYYWRCNCILPFAIMVVAMGTWTDLALVLEMCEMWEGPVLCFHHCLQLMPLLSYSCPLPFFLFFFFFSHFMLGPTRKCYYTAAARYMAVLYMHWKIRGALLEVGKQAKKKGPSNSVLLWLFLGFVCWITCDQNSCGNIIFKQAK